MTLSGENFTWMASATRATVLNGSSSLKSGMPERVMEKRKLIILVYFLVKQTYLLYFVKSKKPEMTRSWEHCLCSYIRSLVSILLFSESKKCIRFSMTSQRFTNERLSLSRSSMRLAKSFGLLLVTTERLFIWSSTLLPCLVGIIERDFPDAAKQVLQRKVWMAKLEPFLTHLKWVKQLQAEQGNPLPLTGSWHLGQSNGKLNETDCCFNGSDICQWKKTVIGFGCKKGYFGFRNC